MRMHLFDNLRGRARTLPRTLGERRILNVGVVVRLRGLSNEHAYSKHSGPLYHAACPQSCVGIEGQV